MDFQANGVDPCVDHAADLASLVVPDRQAHEGCRVQGENGDRVDSLASLVPLGFPVRQGHPRPFPRSSPPFAHERLSARGR